MKTLLLTLALFLNIASAAPDLSKVTAEDIAKTKIHISELKIQKEPAYKALIEKNNELGKAVTDLTTALSTEKGKEEEIKNANTNLNKEIGTLQKGIDTDKLEIKDLKDKVDAAVKAKNKILKKLTKVIIALAIMLGLWVYSTFKLIPFNYRIIVSIAAATVAGTILYSVL
jgi:hypothetical protein